MNIPANITKAEAHELSLNQLMMNANDLKYLDKEEFSSIITDCGRQAMANIAITGKPLNINRIVVSSDMTRLTPTMTDIRGQDAQEVPYKIWNDESTLHFAVYLDDRKIIRLGTVGIYQDKDLILVFQMLKSRAINCTTTLDLRLAL